MCHIFFIHSSVEEHLGSFQFQAITNNAAINIVYDWVSFGCMSKSGIGGSWDRLILNFLRKCHIGFQSGCTSLQFYQQWMSVALTSHPLQHKLLLVLLIIAILTGVSISELFWFAFPLWLRMLNIFLSVFRSFEILLLKIFCFFFLYPIFKLNLQFWCLIS